MANEYGAKGVVTDASLASLSAEVAANCATLEFVVGADSSEPGPFDYEQRIADHGGAG